MCTLTLVMCFPVAKVHVVLLYSCPSGRKYQESARSEEMRILHCTLLQGITVSVALL